MCLHTAARFWGSEMGLHQGPSTQTFRVCTQHAGSNAIYNSNASTLHTTSAARKMNGNKLAHNAHPNVPTTSKQLPLPLQHKLSTTCLPSQT